MNSSRTYPSHALAFKNHTDYACAVQIHLSVASRFKAWLVSFFVGRMK